MYIQLSGRLGNQLFQWAFAHELYSQYGKKPIFFVDKYHHELDNFSTYVENLPDCHHFSTVQVKNRMGFLLKYLDWRNAKTSNYRRQIQEMKCPRVFRSLDSYHLPSLPEKTPFIVSGFFINTKHINRNQDLLYLEIEKFLEKVVLPVELPKRYQVVHVRRGDFATTDKSYGILSSDFYKGNLRVDLPLVMCTESRKDCEEVIQDLNPEIILTSDNCTPWQAIKVISGGSHVVLSNSTLSWWGGFMASKKGISVIIPKPFYKDSENDLAILEFELFTPMPSKFKIQS